MPTSTLKLVLGVIARRPSPGGLSRPRTEPGGRSPPTGFKRDDAARVRAILESRPRVTGVGINWLGLERINEVRAAQGRPALDVVAVDRVGRELDARGPRRRLRPGERPEPPPRRRPARLGRQQHSQVLPAHPEPEPRSARAPPSRPPTTSSPT
ncbi:MAG: hypothetical protein M0C28_03265 [Candidatus Moduliflexus flocculans]|nr:hypothetical protein [Candidatus Moduliflexus flocculans]